MKVYFIRQSLNEEYPVEYEYVTICVMCVKLTIYQSTMYLQIKHLKIIRRAAGHKDWSSPFFWQIRDDCSKYDLVSIVFLKEICNL